MTTEHCDCTLRADCALICMGPQGAEYEYIKWAGLGSLFVGMVLAVVLCFLISQAEDDQEVCFADFEFSYIDGSPQCTPVHTPILVSVTLAPS